jgi:hypothetical protein
VRALANQRPDEHLLQRAAASFESVIKLQEPPAGTNECNSCQRAKKQKQVPTTAEEVNFTDDDPETLLVLLRVANMKFEKVPGSLSYYKLVELAALCDQYDCVDLLRPWFQAWFANEETESVQPGRGQWLFIAWVFGRERTFETLAIKILKEISLDGGEAPIWVKGIIALSVPESLLGNLLPLDRRNKTLTLLFHQKAY